MRHRCRTGGTYDPVPGRADRWTVLPVGDVLDTGTGQQGSALNCPDSITQTRTAQAA